MQAQCVLATMNEDRPVQHIMAYGYARDLGTIYLATYMNTRKFRNMLANPGVSVLWDNRSGNVQDHLDGYSLTAMGSASLMTGPEHDVARDNILTRNPTLKDLLSSTDCRLFSVVIDEYQWTTGYKQVSRYRPQRKHVNRSEKG